MKRTKCHLSEALKDGIRKMIQSSCSPVHIEENNEIQQKSHSSFHSLVKRFFAIWFCCWCCWVFIRPSGLAIMQCSTRRRLYRPIMGLFIFTQNGVHILASFILASALRRWAKSDLLMQSEWTSGAQWFLFITRSFHQCYFWPHQANAWRGASAISYFRVSTGWIKKSSSVPRNIPDNFIALVAIIYKHERVDTLPYCDKASLKKMITVSAP